MADRPPFDPVRACFYLVASIIAVHCVAVLAGVAICGWRILTIDGPYECDPKGRLGELLSAALAAALAFAGGMTRKPPDPPPPTKGSPP